MDRYSRIWVAGHNGMAGSAIVRRLEELGYGGVIKVPRDRLDLRNTVDTENYISAVRPEYVFLCAGRVGGIKANSLEPATFLYDNLMIAANVIHSSYINKVSKLCFLGSSCIYPRNCAQPMKEDQLLSGLLEPTNEGYAIAKLAGYKMAYYYSRQYGMNTISLMPCNLYGRNDHFNLERAHVLSSLVKRFVDAADEGSDEVSLWGTGAAMREFMNVDDFARAAVMLMERLDSPDIINVGTGHEISVRDLAYKIAWAAGYKGRLAWDDTMPDGMPRKCLDISRLASYGFSPEISLDRGIEALIGEYRERKKHEAGQAQA